MNLIQKIFLFSTKPSEADTPMQLSPGAIRYYVPREELKIVFRRGLNTMDPQKMPEWMHDLSEDLESKEDVTFAILVSK